MSGVSTRILGRGPTKVRTRCESLLYASRAPTRPSVRDESSGPSGTRRLLSVPGRKVTDEGCCPRRASVRPSETSAVE